MPATRPKRLGFETLESRQMLAGDLFYDPELSGSFDRIVFVGADASEITVGDPTPVVGQKVYVAIDWSAMGLDPGDSYLVQFDMDGELLDYPFFDPYPIPDPFDGTDYPAMYHGGWIAQPGTHTITVTLDPDNTVAETNEANNTFTLEFTTLDADSLPVKFITPLPGEQNVDWVLGGYVDVDPKFNTEFVGHFEDYQGNTITTRDFHNGLDFGIANFAAQDAGLEVLAAAAGTVIEIREGDFDRQTALFNGDLGNYVFIDHGNGWVTQYWHLRRDTITVAVNDEVVAGQVLGLVGSSGNSGGPHLHFEVQHNHSPVEPFIAPEQYFVPSDFDNSGHSTGSDFLTWQRNAGTTSGATRADGDANGDGAVNSADLAFWEAEYGSAPLPYVFDPVLPNNVLDFGVTNDIQDGVSTGFGLPYEQFIERPSEVETFPGNGEWILAWAVFTSVEAGDTWEAQLFRPDGTQVIDYPAVAFAEDRPIDSGLFNPGLTENIPGTWRVDFLYNDVKVAERTFQVGAAAPEMRVFEDGSGTYILDGRATPFDLGEVVQGGPGSTMTFKVENHGYADLVISNVSIPAGFTVSEALNATIAAGTSDTFTVLLDSSVVGTKSGQIVINSNDASEASFSFLVEGEVTAPLASLSLQEDTPAPFFFDLVWQDQEEEHSENYLAESDPVDEVAFHVHTTERADLAPVASDSETRPRVRELRRENTEEESAADSFFDQFGEQLLTL